MNICFVTNELHPFKPGGIGRLMYNFAVQNRDRKTNRHNFYFLISSLEVSNVAALAEYFEQNGLGTVVATPSTFSYFDETEAKLFGRLEANEYSDRSFVRKSLEYYNGLLYLQNRYNINLDVIEFPDYGAWGFSTLAAKCAGLHFQDSKIVVRLHSTGGIIHDAEPFYHRKDKSERVFSELERQCIEQADIVVSHLESITRANQEFYGFGRDWREKVIHEFPPIFLEATEFFETDGTVHSRDFIFSSRLQPFKRPDLFVKAGVMFFDAHPEYEGRFLVVSYGWDHAYIGWLRDLVPERHKSKIVFILNAEASLRNKLLENAIVVVPSNYESLCVFAYESALRHAKLILNRKCIAFGEADYWQQGENCLMFDGTAEDLVHACEEALAWDKPRLRPLPESLCYWHQPNLPAQAETAPAKSGRLALIGFGFSSLAEVNEKLFELAPLLAAGKLEFHALISNAHRDLQAFDLPRSVHLHFSPWDNPGPDYFNRLIREIEADYIAFVTPTTCATPEFYRIARTVLDRETGVDIVTSHVHALSEEDLKDSRWQEGNRDVCGGEGWAIVAIGGAPSVAPWSLNLVSSLSCVRHDLAVKHPFQEEAGAFFLSSFLISAIKNGARVLVVPKLAITEIQLPVSTRFLSEQSVLASL
jgi:glycosyltransferase involved in cell wall biosynthesis